MLKNLLNDAVYVTQQAAIACMAEVGRGDNKKADACAVASMRQTLGDMNIKGKVVIGEGERDEAPMLYIGEQVGRGWQNYDNQPDMPLIDIALDPLEGTTIAANAQDNSLTVLALANQGGFLHAPDIYMEKLAANINRDDVISLEQEPRHNILEYAKFVGKNPADITVCILDRERHADMIDAVRVAGAKVKLIGDGDVQAIISTQLTDNIDLYMGQGGSPEGVLAAAALACLGGFMQGKLIIRNQAEQARADKIGVDVNKVYSRADLASGDIIFSATGVTDGNMVSGVKIADDGKISTETIVICSATKALHKIKTITMAKN